MQKAKTNGLLHHPLIKPPDFHETPQLSLRMVSVRHSDIVPRPRIGSFPPPIFNREWTGGRFLNYSFAYRTAVWTSRY